jgi:hypothetical protein
MVLAIESEQKLRVLGRQIEFKDRLLDELVFVLAGVFLEVNRYPLDSPPQLFAFR